MRIQFYPAIAVAAAFAVLSAEETDGRHGLIASILPISGRADIAALPYFDAKHSWENRHPIAVTNTTDADIEFTAHTNGPQVTFEFRDGTGSRYLALEPLKHGSGMFRKYRIAPNESALIHARLTTEAIPEELLRKLKSGVKILDVRVSFTWGGWGVQSEWRTANVYNGSAYKN